MACTEVRQTDALYDTYDGCSFTGVESKVAHSQGQIHHRRVQLIAAHYFIFQLILARLSS